MPAPHSTLRALALAGALAVPFAASAQGPRWTPDSHTKAALVGAVSVAKAGEPFWVALHLQMEPRWHTYWRTAGDAGGPTHIEWKLPPGVTADTILWPAPKRLESAGLVSFAYEDEVILPVRITPGAVSAGSTIALRGKASWIACDKVCIPGSGDVALDIPVAAATTADALWGPRIDATRAVVPPGLPAGWTTAARTTTTGYEITVTPPAGTRLDAKGVTFYPATPDALFHFTHGAAQKPTLKGKALVLTLVRQDGEVASPEVSGLFVRDGGWPGGVRAFTASMPVAGAPAIAAVPTASLAAPGTGATVPSVGASPAVNAAESPAGDITSLGAALALALLGGLLLNVMPCVFPVLAIKVMGFAEMAGEDDRMAQKHGLVFGAGVILSFWTLAAVLLALRAGGAALGWGFQMQSPIFVGAMVVVLFVLSLSLTGAVEIGLGLTRLGELEGKRHDYLGSLFNGVLAVVVATPCTAPLMGAALAYAVLRPAFESFLVFTALGVGLSLPYVVLPFVPALMHRLPRPGAWMQTLKRVMSVPMFATVAWLGWVFWRQTSDLGLLWLIVGAAAAFGVVKFWEQADLAPNASARRTRVALMAASAVATVVIVSRAAHVTPALAAVPTAPFTDRYGLTWTPWSDQQVAQLRAAGHPVFLDFTADWCLTCKVNERVTFADAAVKARLGSGSVALVRADWTARDSTIGKAVASFGRSGIPLYVLYPADPTKLGVVLPEVLTPGILLGALDKLPAASTAKR
jgi:thiol:disulfide interchange protein DsbD